ncbi:MAG: hypothetical protein ACPIOQ_24310, partial [Promethearchaeia archaeon]
RLVLDEHSRLSPYAATLPTPADNDGFAQQGSSAARGRQHRSVAEGRSAAVSGLALFFLQLLHAAGSNIQNKTDENQRRFLRAGSNASKQR